MSSFVSGFANKLRDATTKYTNNRFVSAAMTTGGYVGGAVGALEGANISLNQSVRSKNNDLSTTAGAIGCMIFGGCVGVYLGIAAGATLPVSIPLLLRYKDYKNQQAQEERETQYREMANFDKYTPYRQK